LIDIYLLAAPGERKPRRGGDPATFELTEADGSTRRFSTCGRFAMTLKALIEAGAEGVTSMTLAQSWAIRTSHYVYRLRRDHGLMIETIKEPHDGEFAGHHARYVLHDRVRVVDDGVSDQRAAA
jgi:hypothetical protein